MSDALHTIASDVRHALRQLRRGPALAPPEDGQRRAHAVARLATGRVGLTDDGERRHARRDVDLDGDRKAVDANDGGGRDRGEHGNPLCGSEPGGGSEPRWAYEQVYASGVTASMAPLATG